MAGTVRVPIFRQIGTARDQRVLAHPDHLGGKLIDEFGRIARVGKEIAARDVDLVGEGQGDGITGPGMVERAIERDDFADPRRSARAGDKNLIARRDRTRNHGPGKSAKLGMRPVDPLHRKTKPPPAIVTRGVDRLEMLEQGRPLIPRHPIAIAG